MGFFDTHLLNIVIFLPLVFAALVLLLPQGEHGQIRTVTLIGMLVDLVFGVWAYARYLPGGPEFQLEYRVPWFTEFGLSYHVGMDGLGLFMMLLTSVGIAASVGAGIRAGRDRPRAYYGLVLLLLGIPVFVWQRRRVPAKR